MEKNKIASIIKNLSIIVISTLVSLLVVEFCVRLFLPQDRMVTWIEMHERGFVMNQSAGTAFHEFENIKVDYRFTEHRTRGLEPTHWDSSSINVLTIGDSFTFGLLLQEEDTYISHLQNWVDSVSPKYIEFQNAAVGGAGMADWPAWLNTFGNELNPDKIIYFINNQDVIRALSKNLYVLTDSTQLTLQESQRWKPRSTFVNLSKKGWYRSLQANSDLANLIVKILWRSVYFADYTNDFSSEESSVLIPESHQFTFESRYSLHLSKALLKKMQNWCFKNDCDLIIANTGYFVPQSSDPHTIRIHEYLKNTDEFTYIDIYPCISKAVNSDFTRIQIPNDDHPNEAGANLIFECLKDELLPFISDK